MRKSLTASGLIVAMEMSALALRFALESGHWDSPAKCPPCAKSKRPLVIRANDIAIQ
jgi:hypothetical protein